MDSVIILFLVIAANVPSVLSTQSVNTSCYKEVYPPVDLSGNLSNHLFFALVQSFGAVFNGSGNIAGVKVALDGINNSTDILPNYTLHYTLTDSQCVRTIALDALFNQLLSEDGISKVVVLGCGCSLATEPTAEVSHYYNVNHVSCSTASTELTDRTRFKKYFQLLQTMVDIAPIYEGLFNMYEWKYASIIVQKENLYTVAMDSLKERFLSNNINFSEKLFESNESIAGLKEPIDPNARIFIIASYEGHAREFICEAYRRGLRYPRHLFIFMAWYQGRWWLRRDENETCTAEERETVLLHALLVHHFNFEVPDDYNTTTRLTGSEFKEEEKRKIRGPPKYQKNQISPYCYDATWTIAYALNNALKDVSTSTVDIGYSNVDFHQRMFNFITATNFTGMTGPVKFSDQGIRKTNNLQVFQMVKNTSSNITGRIKLVKIGEVMERAGRYIFESNISDEVLWPDGRPHDGVAKNTRVTVHPLVIVVFDILASAGIAFTAFCLFINHYFRKKRLFKLSSPNLNYLIGTGAIILYVDVYLHVIPTTDPQTIKVLCSIVPWLTAIGYSLCYGTIVAKMIRVNYIFNNPKPNMRNILKDWKLAIGILFMVAVDIIILVIYTSIEGSNGVQVKETLNKENPSRSEEAFGVMEYYYILICKSKRRNIFLGILYGYKAAMQVIALILAFTTRKVKVKGLNDAIYIAAAIYITSLLWAIVILSTYTLTEYLNVFVTVFCLGLLVGTTAIISLVFIPKMVILYKDPEGKTVFKKATSSNSNIQLAQDAGGLVKGNTTASILSVHETSSGLGKGANTEEQAAIISTLRKRVTELEQTLLQMNVTVEVQPETN